MQKMVYGKTDMELFTWTFTNMVKREIDSYSTDTKHHYHAILFKEKMIEYMQKHYPFVEISNKLK